MIYAYFSKEVSTVTYETLSGHFERIILFLNERFRNYKYHEFGVL